MVKLEADWVHNF